MAYPGDPDDSPSVERLDTNDDDADAVVQPAHVAADVGDAEPADAPSPGPRTGSIPELKLLLDPLISPPAAGTAPPSRTSLSPNQRAALGTALGLAVIGGICGALIATRQRATPFAHEVATTLAPAAPRPAPSASAAELPAAPTPAASNATLPRGTPMPAPWRVAELAALPDHKLLEGTVERRAFVDALRDSGVARSQIYRVVDAFRGVKTFDKTKPHDTFVVALELPSRKVKAFEYQASPTEIYQARTRDDGTLVGSRLDLHLETKRLAAAVTVGEDLAGSLTAAGLDASLLEQLDDALEGRTQLSSIRAGSRLRLIADYETALGVFARYTDLIAVELSPAQGNAEPVRVYHFKGHAAQGYFDARGKQPFKGGFRTPIPFARISSRFNMHRMHPILHVIRPHNGVDFAAASGTPVYAAAAGTVESMGDSGPSGNLITIKHASGLTTGYAHLSRFAPHLTVGQAVDTRQLIGYSGSTGRSTGPHLHFSTKRNGIFIDPLTLKLDGDRVLPKNDRAAFEEEREQLDKALDAILLPSGPPTHVEPAEVDDQEPLEDIDRDH